MLAVRIAPPKTPVAYDAATALGAPTPIISTTPIVTPEPTVETAELEIPMVNSTDAPKPIKYKGDHASLSNEEMQALIARVKSISLDPDEMDPIRRHMLEFLTDLNIEMADRKTTEAEAKNKKD